MTRSIARGLLASLIVSVCELVLCLSAFAGQHVGLRIIVVRGSGAENVINEVPPEPLAIRVTDGDNRPVSAANVVFTAPSNGPGGAFPTGPAFNTFSDEEGRALGVLFRTNSLEGSYMIQIRAEYMGQVATTSIRQINVATKKSKMSTKRKFVIGAIAGVGAAIVAGGLSGGGGSGSSAAPPAAAPTITFGGSSIGGR